VIWLKMLKFGDFIWAKSFAC